MVKNLGFWIVFIIYIISFGADVTTTFMVKNKEVLETNIAYKSIGFIGIILLNLIIIWLLWWLYSRQNSTPAVRFILIMSMLMIVAVRIYAVQNAWYFIKHPVILIQAVAIATPAAIKETTRQVMMIAYPPFTMGVIGYIFWRIDHHVRKRE